MYRIRGLWRDHIIVFDENCGSSSHDLERQKHMRIPWRSRRPSSLLRIVSQLDSLHNPGSLVAVHEGPGDGGPVGRAVTLDEAAGTFGALTLECVLMTPLCMNSNRRRGMHEWLAAYWCR